MRYQFRRPWACLPCFINLLQHWPELCLCRSKHPPRTQRWEIWSKAACRQYCLLDWQLMSKQWMQRINNGRLSNAAQCNKAWLCITTRLAEHECYGYMHIIGGSPHRNVTLMCIYQVLPNRNLKCGCMYCVWRQSVAMQWAYALDIEPQRRNLYVGVKYTAYRDLSVTEGIYALQYRVLQYRDWVNTLCYAIET